MGGTGGEGGTGGMGGPGGTYASDCVAVARPELAPLVTSGIAETGPRRAAALSMPGLSPAACPPDGGGGGENGWAGGVKLVTPGAADIGGVIGGRGIIGCIGACEGGTGGGVIRFAFGEGAYIPVEDCAGTIVCAGVGGAVWVTAANDCAGAELVTGAEAVEDPDEDTADIAEAGNAAAGPATALTPEPTIPTAACIPLIAADSATEAAATAAPAIDPPEIAGIDGVINAAPNASSVAPYRTPAPALLGHMNPKYSRFKSAIRGVNPPNTIGLMTSSAASSNRFACATGAGTI